MKKLVLFLLTLSSTSIAQTVPKFSELELRIQGIESFVTKTLPEIKTQLNQSLKSIEEFKDPKLVNPDEKQKILFFEKINYCMIEIEAAENSLSLSSAKNSMSELDKIIKEKGQYTAAKNSLQTMEKDSSSSIKLKKYFSHIKARKYTQAKIVFALLNFEEKSKASEYEKVHNYIIREAGRQEFVETEIKRLKNKVIKSLTYPENAIAQINLQFDEEKKTTMQFNAFKKAILDSTQYDYLLPTSWNIGLFSCEADKKPKYFRFKNYPNLLVLDNEGNYNAILKLAAGDPKKLDVTYRCEKLGSFGVCLDNKEKKLCKLDANCAEDLSRMEENFDRNLFFSRYQGTFPQHLLESKRAEMLDPLKLNLISELAKLNRLGFYQSQTEVYNLITPMIEKTKVTQANSPEDFYKKMKAELALYEKTEKARLQKFPGFVATSTKGTYTLQVLSYMMATMDSELTKMKEADTLQKYSYENCSNNSSDMPEFCQSYSAFVLKSKQFDSVEEIPNIVPEECPRVVFRLQ